MQDAVLCKRLQRLATRLGVRRTNLAEELGEELCELWYVDPNESSEIVRTKVAWQLERLILKLGDEEMRQIARISYNFDAIDIPEEERKTEKDRHNWMYKNKSGYSYSGARANLRTKIIPEFVRDLRANPPPPTPFELLAASSKATTTRDETAVPEEADRGPNVDNRNLLQVGDNQRRPTATTVSHLASPEEARLADYDQKPTDHPHPPVNEQPPPVASGPRNALDFPEPTPFVPQPTPWNLFQKAHDDGHRIIALEGEPGNGKARLARELLREKLLKHGGTVAYIRNDQLNTDIRGALAAAGIQISNEDPIAAFAKHLSSDKYPTYVLLDGMEERSLVKALIPSSTHSIVVITSQKDVRPAGRGTAIMVGQMEDAVALARLLLPEANDEDLESIVFAVGYRPLAIVHGCGYIIAKNILDIQEFLRSMWSDPAGTLEIPEEDGWLTLPAIYTKILHDLQTTDPLVAHVLELLACMAPNDMPRAVAREAFSAGTGTSVSSKKFERALFILQDRYLIQLGDDGISIHSLSQRLIRSIVQQDNNEQQRCRSLYVALMSQIEISESLERIVPVHALVLLPHLQLVFPPLLKLDIDTRKPLGLRRGALALVRGLSHTGFVMKHGGVIAPFPGLDLMPHKWGTIPPDLAAAYREWLLMLYRTGGYELPLEDYLRYLDQINAADTQGYSTPVEYMQSLISAAYAYLVVDAYEMAYSHVMRVNEVAVFVGGISPDTAGDSHLIMGELFAVFGWYGEARQVLRQALEYYSSLPQPVLALRVSARAYASIAEAFLAGGATQQENEALLKELNDFRVAAEAEVGDILGSARLQSTAIRLYVCRLVKDYAQSGMTMRLADEIPELAAFVQHVQVRLERISAALEESNFWVEASTINIIADYRRYRTQVENLAEYCIDSDKYFVGAKLHVVVCRASLCYDGWNRKQSGHIFDQMIDDCKWAADLFAQEYCAEYWYAEALAMAGIAAALTNRQYRLLLDAVRESYNAIGRPDRFDQLVQVIEAIGIGREAFEQGMRAFLAY